MQVNNNADGNFVIFGFFRRRLKKMLLGPRQLQWKYNVKQKRCTQANLSDSLRALSAKDS